MDGSSGTIFRKLSAEIGGAVLLAGGLLALGVPVSLGDYDTWGIQIGCGNGYYSELLQAQADDELSGRQSAPDGTRIAVRPATDYVGRCNSAIAHRRAWAMPTAGLGALVLLAQVARWARSREMKPGTSAHAWSAEHPDDNMHEAQDLDRRDRAHWEHPLEHEALTPRHVRRHSGVWLSVAGDMVARHRTHRAAI